MTRGRKYAYAALACAWLSGLGGGLIVGRLLTKKALDELYEERLEEEVKSSIAFLLSQNVDLETVEVSTKTDEELVEEQTILTPLEDGQERVFPDLNRPLLTQQDEKVYTSPKEIGKYNAISTENGYIEEETEEAPDLPDDDPNITVISQDLFLSNVTGWPQKTLSYFADGGVLDDEGNFVKEHTELIGVGPYRFGDESGDPEVVYIRNKKIEQEFEVIKDGGNASEFLAHGLQEMYSKKV